MIDKSFRIFVQNKYGKTYDDGTGLPKSTPPVYSDKEISDF